MNDVSISETLARMDAELRAATRRALAPPRSAAACIRYQSFLDPQPRPGITVHEDWLSWQSLCRKRQSGPWKRPSEHLLQMMEANDKR